jgi:hypothetical protein
MFANATMKRIRNLTDTQILLVGIAGIVLVSVLTVLVAPSSPGLSIDNNRPDGIHNLSLWLKKSGYQVNTMVSRTTELNNLDMLFLINPYAFAEDELTRLREWVRHGGTLILVGRSTAIDDILWSYGLKTLFVSNSAAAAQVGPTLTNPPFADLRLQPVNGLYGLRSESGGLVMHMAVQGFPVIASLDDKMGRIWYVGSVYPFTNNGLHYEASTSFILNLLTGINPPARIGFSEGLIQVHQTLSDWLFASAPGWAILSAIGITFVFLALRGRRFGAPVPLPEERIHREPFEYIQAIANLFRHSGDRAETLGHYYRQFRRILIQRYALDATLNDTALANTISTRDPDVDGAALKALLSDLSRSQVSEAELVRTVLAADEWLKRPE